MDILVLLCGDALKQQVRKQVSLCHRVVVLENGRVVNPHHHVAALGNGMCVNRLAQAAT